jgi:hypothetical protein
MKFVIFIALYIYVQVIAAIVNNNAYRGGEVRRFGRIRLQKVRQYTPNGCNVYLSVDRKLQYLLGSYIFIGFSFRRSNRLDEQERK